MTHVTPYRYADPKFSVDIDPSRNYIDARKVNPGISIGGYAVGKVITPKTFLDLAFLLYSPGEHKRSLPSAGAIGKLVLSEKEVIAGQVLDKGIITAKTDLEGFIEGIVNVKGRYYSVSSRGCIYAANLTNSEPDLDEVSSLTIPKQDLPKLEQFYKVAVIAMLLDKDKSVQAKRLIDHWFH
jgi:hypothetical protein